MSDSISYAWRGPLEGDDIDELAGTGEVAPPVGWWERIRSHSLGWVTGRDTNGLLVGFVNVAWDGAAHAFLMDTKTRPSHRHRGIGTHVVRVAVDHARAAGCEWLHLDFTPNLGDFYLVAGGFRRTDAGLIHLAILG